MKVILPQGYEPVELPKPEKLECSAALFSFSYKYWNGVLTAVRIVDNKKDMVNTEDYKSYKEFFNKLYEIETAQILLKKKAS